MQRTASIGVAAVAVIITAMAVWHLQRPITTKQATWEDVQTEAVAGGYRLITTEALSDRYLKSPSDMLLVDTRQEWEYRTGHIEGAFNFPMEPTWWARWRKADDLKDSLGPDKERFLVFY